LGENAGLILDAALSADGKYSGIVEAGTLGDTLAFGHLVYLNEADSRWEKMDANVADGYDKKAGMVLVAGNDGDVSKILLWGKIRADSLFPTLTIGNPVYLSETAGEITLTAPTTADAAQRVIGYGDTSDELAFQPSSTVVIHV
jgi:hypothetical protein